MPTPVKIENTKDVIEFEIGTKVYKVPLATGLLRADLEKLNTQKALEEFFRKHLGAKVWDGLTVGAQNQVAQAWAKANEKTSGIPSGE